MTRPLWCILAEDDADSREALTAILEANGFVVSAASNGIDALDIMRREFALRQHAGTTPLVPDVAMIDWSMPLLDGFGLVSAMRNHRHLSKIPIIIVSAYVDDAAKTIPWIASCSKPIDVPELLSKIYAEVARSRGSRAAP